MDSLPSYVSLIFVLTTFLSLGLLFTGTGRSKKVFGIAILWLLIQGLIASSDFYLESTSIPPRFVLLVWPPLILILGLFVSKKGRAFIDSCDVKMLTWLHIVRVPVEIVLYWLFIYKMVPQLMTFEGRNFDILAGLTAPFIVYFGYIKKSIGKKTLLAWNFICLALLINIVVNAILSAPFATQQFAFDQPNIAVLYWPFVWLPAFVVPVVLFAHLVSIRKLLT